MKLLLLTIGLLALAVGGIAIKTPEQYKDCSEPQHS